MVNSGPGLFEESTAQQAAQKRTKRGSGRALSLTIQDPLPSCLASGSRFRVSAPIATATYSAPILYPLQLSSFVLRTQLVALYLL